MMTANLFTVLTDRGAVLKKAYVLTFTDLSALSIKQKLKNKNKNFKNHSLEKNEYVNKTDMKATPSH